MLKNEDDVLVLDQKAGIYGLFANMLLREPGVEFLKLFQQEENEKIFKSYNLDPLLDIKHLPIEQQAETIAVEYARLFLPPARLAPPLESLQMGEGKLWGKSTIEVDKIYKKFGFALDGDFKDTPDHLSAQISFLGQLHKLESEYLEKGLGKEREGVLEVKKYFLKNHILNWFTRFKEDVNQNARLSYYKDMVDLLDVFLNEENNDLIDIKDLPFS